LLLLLWLLLLLLLLLLWCLVGLCCLVLAVVAAVVRVFGGNLQCAAIGWSSPDEFPTSTLVTLQERSFLGRGPRSRCSLAVEERLLLLGHHSISKHPHTRVT